MQRATFCFCPSGDTPTSKRIFDALAARCIPVIAADDFAWPFALQTDASAFSLRVAERVAANATALIAALRALPAERVGRMQAAVSANFRRFRYGSARVAGEAFDGILTELRRRRAALRASGCATPGGLARGSADGPNSWPVGGPVERRRALHGPQLVSWLRAEYERQTETGARQQQPARRLEHMI